ncbi:MAG: carnitine 3-dehydrogenase, partial [Gammaproteobacteria bacterium]|nr:carnitine 3-dehydrogenase [Gammaproteobacteria bacterium]NNL51580.1 carnitine 3-dehydrogenase [Woeseiaceae bacterium]
MTPTEPQRRKFAVIGSGVIGGGWAARFLLNGWDVAVFDPHPDVRQRIGEVLDNARMSLPSLADVAMPREGTLSFAASLQEAVDGADWIQESVPEELAVKHQVVADIEAHAGDDAIIASSTSGFKPSELQQGARDPGKIIVAHPFNPVYLLPLVEVVTSDRSSPSFVKEACDTLASVGFEPLRVRKEIDAHLADR